jgi:hypothetical protein
LAIGLSRRKPLKFPNIGANCLSQFRGEALALPRDAAFWTAALHPAGEGPVPGTRADEARRDVLDTHATHLGKGVSTCVIRIFQSVPQKRSLHRASDTID